MTSDLDCKHTASTVLCSEMIGHSKPRGFKKHPDLHRIGVVVRRRRCYDCGLKFNTYEFRQDLAEQYLKEESAFIVEEKKKISALLDIARSIVG
jgi:hypothetical protein